MTLSCFPIIHVDINKWLPNESSQCRWLSLKSFCPLPERIAFRHLFWIIRTTKSTFLAVHFICRSLSKIRCYAPVIGSLCRIQCPGQSGQKSLCNKAGIERFLRALVSRFTRLKSSRRPKWKSNGYGAKKLKRFLELD